MIPPSNTPYHFVLTKREANPDVCVCFQPHTLIIFAIYLFPFVYLSRSRSIPVFLKVLSSWREWLTRAVVRLPWLKYKLLL